MHVKKKEKEVCACGCKVEIDLDKSETCAVHSMPRDSAGNPGTRDKLRVVFRFSTGCNNPKCDGCKVKGCAIVILDAFANFVNAVPFGAALGENTFEWDLKDITGNVVKQGCYIIQVIVKLNNGNQCTDAYVIHVLECGEIQQRNANQIKTYNKMAASATTPVACNRAALLVYYSRLLFGVRKCLCLNLAADLESGKNKNWDKPCFIACITAHIANGIQKEFGSKKGKVYLSANKWAKKAGPGGLGLHEFAGFVRDILSIENKIRGKAMSACGKCTFTKKDEDLIVACIQAAISTTPTSVSVPVPFIPVPLPVPPPLLSPPAFFLKLQLSESTAECKKSGTKKSCSVPQLR